MKTLKKLGIESIFMQLLEGINMIKATYENTQLTVYLMVKDQIFSLCNQKEDKDFCFYHLC